MGRFVHPLVGRFLHLLVGRFLPWWVDFYTPWCVDFYLGGKISTLVGRWQDCQELLRLVLLALPLPGCWNHKRRFPKPGSEKFLTTQWKWQASNFLSLPLYLDWSRALFGRWHPQIQSTGRHWKLSAVHPGTIYQKVIVYDLDRPMQTNNKIWWCTFMMSLSSIISVVMTWRDISLEMTSRDQIKSSSLLQN